MSKDRYLFEKIEEYIKDGVITFDELPNYLTENLAGRIELRKYQEEAFNYFIEYYEDRTIKLRKNKQLHLLFHMATGSGKTVMMAGTMLYLYRQGYRNFVFFVNTDNIIAKTKTNFIEKSSTKYLFNEKIVIDGEEVMVKEVNNFQSYDENAINIKFTTIQQLHIDLNKVKECNVTISDFEDEKVVLIADEAHHFNSETKAKAKGKKDDDSDNWEKTALKVLNANKDNILLEFTATAGLKKQEIQEKYLDKVIYDYPLLKFRLDGYTKDFNNFQSTFEDTIDRVITAILLSQYRLKLFQSKGLNKKPALLLKSKTIKDSEEFYDEFYEYLEGSFSENEILKVYKNAETTKEPTLTKMMEFFKANDISPEALANEIKTAFSKTHSIIMNSGDKKVSVEDQKRVNELERLDNPLRLIFTVDMLNEGWDVLNLYDIVRLHTDRQSGRKKVSPATISEAQLIGRGARYYPFKIKDSDEAGLRKYDNDPDNDMKICETLLYHSFEDSKYIEELRRALEETGFSSVDEVEFTYVLKEEFMKTDTYKIGKLFCNDRVKKDRSNIDGLPENFLHDVDVNLAVRFKELSLSSSEEIVSTNEDSNKTKRKISELSKTHLYVVNKAIRQYPVFKFNRLKSYFPKLTSINEFITSDRYAGGIDIIYNSAQKDLSSVDIYKGLVKAFGKLSTNILKIKDEYRGTTDFVEVNLKDYVKDAPRKKIKTDKMGEGVSQNAPIIDASFKLDLSKEDWFVYNDNYGTTEEKKFVKFFSNRIAELEKVYDEVYLIRNERSLHIFSFNNGLRFEPDYILILKKDKHDDTFVQQQIFVEPKGSIFMDDDNWKQEFLLELEKNAKAVLYHDDNSEYKIIGLPFYNDSDTVTFKDAFEKLM